MASNEQPAATTERSTVSDLSDYQTWKASARRSAEAAVGIYASTDYAHVDFTVEAELALHLARALRELDRLETWPQCFCPEAGQDPMCGQHGSSAGWFPPPSAVPERFRSTSAPRFT